MTTTYYPRPEILTHPGFRQGHVAIEASAGTGKTFTLEHLVLDLIIHNRASIEQVLVVTFTDAATRELRERVRSLIRKVCTGGETVKPNRGIGHYWEIDDVTRTRLQEALFRFDGAAISTIHGFCQRILSEQAFLGGRLFNQEHVDGLEAFSLAFREEVRVLLSEGSLSGEALRGWIEQKNLLSNLQNLLYGCHREGCPHRSRLTPKWDPPGFWKALQGLPGQKDLQGAIQLFFSNRYVKNGYERLVTSLFDTAAPVSTDPGPDPLEAASLFLEWAGKPCSINNVRDSRINHIKRAADQENAPNIIKTLADRLEEITLRAASHSSFFVYELLPRIQRRLNARKLSLGLIDYDDMLTGVREALRGENARALLNVLRQRWKYALVDEFQDTDPVQWEIFRRIFVDGGGEHHLFIIGDPKQAIYGFRGADVYTYDAAKTHLLNKYSASRLSLKKNYRSTAELIAAVNTILATANQTGEGFFSGLNRYEEPVEWGGLTGSAFENDRPAVPVHLIRLYSERGDLNAASLRRGLADFIAREISSLTDPKTGLIVGGENGRRVKLSDIYILTRSGQEGRQIGEVLQRYGIHYAFYKLEGLFSTAEAENIYRLLTAIESPQDPASRMASWLTPFFEVPLSELQDWQEVGEHHPLAARLLHWKKLAVAGEWAHLFDHILTASGLARRLIFFDRERELTNYLHLFELLLAETHTRPLTLPELARRLKAFIDGRKAPPGREGNMQRLETDKEAVQILTMHKAKGLEAEVIFVAGGFGNPSTGALDIQIYHQNNRRCLHVGPAVGEIAAAIEAENREENQRLAYVALTRARSRLYLPYFGVAPAGEGREGRNYGYKNLGNFYRALQTQLDLLHDQGRLDDGRLFLLRESSCAVPSHPKQALQIGLMDWPAEHLLQPFHSSVEEAKRIKSVRRGVVLTSYTRMSRRRGRQRPVYEEDDQADWRSEEVEGEVVDDILAGPALPTAALSVSASELPGGREIGIFLHTLLEEAAARDMAGLTSEQWSLLPVVRIGAAACARRHGFPEKYLPAALHLIYRAFMTPLMVQDREHGHTLEMPGGIASGKYLQAEMSFVYPIPENFHPRLAGNESAGPSDLDNLPFRARRGYLRGLIDLVFEHGGRIYLLDWKSDSLSSFDEDRLQAHVEANYRLQAQIYLQAVIRLLGIRSEEKYESLFGGILYLFIRGMGGPEAAGRVSRGAWFSRPDWSAVVVGEQKLISCREWGEKVIAPEI